MGHLVHGVWHDGWIDTKTTGGAFVRPTTKFRNWITPDGTTGPSGSGGFKAETGRYHLYVSLACPLGAPDRYLRRWTGWRAICGKTATCWATN